MARLRGNRKYSVLRGKLREPVPRCYAMFRANVVRHQIDGGRQHGSVIGKAEHRQDVGNNVGRQHEIGERADQRGLHRQRRTAVECTVVGGDQILGERDRGRDAARFTPKMMAKGPSIVATLPECRLCKFHAVHVVGDCSVCKDQFSRLRLPIVLPDGNFVHCLSQFHVELGQAAGIMGR